MSSRRRTRGVCIYERRHTHAHTYTRRGYICIAETRRPCKFNICAVMEWSCRSGGNRVCAYLTQMLKLSYARYSIMRSLGVYRDTGRERENGRCTKALGIHPGTRESHIWVQPISGKEHPGTWKMRGETGRRDEKEN